MDHANTGNWSQHLARQRAALDWWHREHPRVVSPRTGAVAMPVTAPKRAPRDGPTSMLTFFRKDPGGHTTTKTKSPTDVKTEPVPLEQPPSTGRTTPLGRKVERPADDSVAGPSGQKDRVHHDRKHTNK